MLRQQKSGNLWIMGNTNNLSTSCNPANFAQCLLPIIPESDRKARIKIAANLLIGQAG